MPVTITETPQSRAFVALQRLVGRKPDVTAGDVAEELCVQHSYACRLLNDLERMGLAAGRNGEGGHVLWAIA